MGGWGGNHGLFFMYDTLYPDIKYKSNMPYNSSMLSQKQKLSGKIKAEKNVLFALPSHICIHSRRRFFHLRARSAQRFFGAKP